MPLLPKIFFKPRNNNFRPRNKHIDITKNPPMFFVAAAKPVKTAARTMKRVFSSCIQPRRLQNASSPKSESATST